MNDNEKAAVAAGLFDPDEYEQCGGCAYSRFGMQHTHYNCGGPCEHGKWDPHEVEAPDMHDPANLWRALEGLSKVPGWSYRIAAHASCEPFCTLGVSYKARTSCLIPSDVTKQADTLAKAMFGALVALYDAEHPEAI